MRGLGSYAFMQLCNLAGQSGHSVCAGEKMQQALGSLAYCLPHSALKFCCGPVGFLQLVLLREFVYCFNLLLHASVDKQQLGWFGWNGFFAAACFER